MPKFIDLTDHQMGQWTVLGLVTRGPTTWRCRCVCGLIKVVRAGHLMNGASANCGCQKKYAIKHGHARKGRFSKKYKTWRAIKARCNHESHVSSDYYLGLLCDHWQNYENFDYDVEDPPNDDSTIDRIDNTKGYEPGNVRWVTMEEQHRNQSNCVWLEHNGRRMLQSAWAKELGLSDSSLIERIAKYGVEKALSTPRGARLS